MKVKEAALYFGIPQEDIEWVRRTLPTGAHPKVWYKMIMGSANMMDVDPERLAEKKQKELEEYRKGKKGRK